jgi:hypothetical protein
MTEERIAAEAAKLDALSPEAKAAVMRLIGNCALYSAGGGVLHIPDKIMSATKTVREFFWAEQKLDFEQYS